MEEKRPKYNLPYKNTYLKEPFVTENEFRTAKPETITPGTFEEAKQILPDPTWSGHEKEIEMYWKAWQIGIGNIKGYGLKSGAVATSISHDSHNIIVVGANEEDMAAAVNRVVELGGGIVVMDDGKVLGELQLQIAGIMSEAPLIEVNEALENAKEQAFKLGVSRGVDPFMTLSFMALTVIPTLRLTTRGVFDVINQRYV